MFSWSKKKDTKRRPRPEKTDEENEFGIKIDKGPSDKQLEAELRALAGVDELPDDEMNLNEGEDDVESELLRLVGGSKGKKPAKKPPNPDVPSLGDITADIGDIDEGDEDVDVDENDPDLLGELLELTQPDEAIEDEPESDSEPEPQSPPPAGETDVMSVLKERLKMYKTAEAKAKESNESSRARRFKRGIKTLEDLIKKAKAGRQVSPDDIPPVIALNLKPAPPVQTEEPNGEADVNGTALSNGGEAEETDQGANAQDAPQDVMTILMERLKMYQTAEAKSAESGETTRARRFSRGIKTIESLIKQARAGKPISPDDIPPEVALKLKPAPPPPPPEENKGLDSADEGIEDEVGNIDLAETPSDETCENKEEEPERNIIDVLAERLQMYKTAEAKAKESGETTRARRFGRGIKTLQDQLKQATAGKPIPPDEIPPPIALNLKPLPVVTNEEEEPRDTPVESDTLVRSANLSPVRPPLKFAPVDEEDFDLDEELLDEEVPRTVMEGLEQRVRIYTKLKEKAQENGDEGLAAENDRNLRTYLNAIRTYKNGGYIDVLKLPSPKGCPPIPIPFQKAMAAMSGLVRYSLGLSLPLGDVCLYGSYVSTYVCSATYSTSFNLYSFDFEIFLSQLLQRRNLIPSSCFSQAHGQIVLTQPPTATNNHHSCRHSW